MGPEHCDKARARRGTSAAPGVLACLGTGSLFGVVLSFGHRFSAVSGALGETLQPLMLGSLLGGIVVACVAAVLLERRGDGVPVAGAAVSAALGALGCLALSGSLLCGDEALRRALVLGGGGAVGASVALLALGWTQVVAAFGTSRLLRVAAGCLVAGTCVSAGFSLAVSSAASCLCVGLLLAVSGCCLAGCGCAVGGVPRVADGLADRGVLSALVGEGRAAAWAAEVLPPSVLRVLAGLWVPLVGVLVGAFIAGLTWDPVVAAEGSQRAGVLMVVSRLVGAALMALALLVLACGFSEDGALEVLMRAVLPVSVGIVLVVPSLRQELTGDVAQAVCDALSAVGFGALTVVALVSLVLAARAARASVVSAMAVLVAALAVAVAVGAVVIGAWGVAGRTVCLVLEGAYLVTIAMRFALPAASGVCRREVANVRAAVVSPARESDGTPMAARSFAGSDFDARCSQLACSQGLSARETQVLPYVGRGYGAAHIGAELGISENTVRTHVRHIYEKTGVSTRDELIGLIDGV